MSNGLDQSKRVLSPRSRELFQTLNLNEKSTQKTPYSPKYPDRSHAKGSTNRIYDADPMRGKSNAPIHESDVRLAFVDSLVAPVSATVDVQKVQRLFTDIFKFPKPHLLISIIGGRKHYEINDDQEEILFNRIIDLALRSKAWLFSDGRKICGVDVVGRIARKAKLTRPSQKLTTIAICASVLVEDIFSDDTQEQVTSSAQFHSNNKANTETRLDNGSSYYIALDNGTTEWFDTNHFRRKLCARITKTLDDNGEPVPLITIVIGGDGDTIKTISKDLEQKTPVLIVDDGSALSEFFKRWKYITKDFDDRNDLDGDEEPIDITLLTKISRKSNTKSEKLVEQPVYLNSNIRRILEHFQKYKGLLQEESKKFEKQPASANKDPANSAEQDGNTKRESIFLYIMYCLQPGVRQYLTIFSLDQNEKFTDTFFRSICHARQEEIKYQIRIKDQVRLFMPKKPSREKNNQSLTDDKDNFRSIHNQKQYRAGLTELIKLAMFWDCIRVAKELIFKSSLENVAEPIDLFTLALLKNKPAFVYEMLRLGFEPALVVFDHDSTPENRYRKLLDVFYTKEYLEAESNCLNEAVGDSSHSDTEIVLTIAELNILLRKLVGEYMRDIYSTNPGDENKVRSPKPDSTGGQTDEIANDGPKGKRNKKSGWTPKQKNEMAIRDLFIWAILTNQIDLAKVFLPFMKYPICAALIASKILLRYRILERKLDRQEDYVKNANYFEEYAVACINLCDKADDVKASEIVLQKIDYFGGVTCLEVAASAYHYSFMSTACCAQAVDHIFYDKLNAPKLDFSSRLGLFLAFISFGLLAPFTITYRKIKGVKPKDSKSSDGNTPKFQQRSITFSDPYSLESTELDSNSVLNRFRQRFSNYHRSIIAKAFNHAVFYLFFILLFSYVLLFQFRIPTNSVPSIHWTEILLYILALCMFIEEVAFLLELDEIGGSAKIRKYFSNIFRIATMVGYLLFFIGFILRFTAVQSENDFSAARIVMAINVELWWIISLKYVVFNELLGPNIVAIIEMLKDLAFFIVILFFVIMGYGVASRSMFYYSEEPIYDQRPIDSTFSGRAVFRHVFYPVYYLLYGDLGSERTYLDSHRDSSWSIATHVLLAFHLLFVNILLINLLIAIFSKRYNEVVEVAKQIWRYQRYVFVKEQFTRSPLFPPISTFIDFYKIGRRIYFNITESLTGRGDPNSSMFKIIPCSHEIIEEWTDFEIAHTYDYTHGQAEQVDNYIIDEGDASESVKNKSEITVPDRADLQEKVDMVHSIIENINQKLSDNDQGKRRSGYARIPVASSQ